MDLWRQIESVAKNRWVGAYWQNKELIVIPTISWSTPRSYEFCFDGVEQNAIVAISTFGCRNSKLQFLRGYETMLKNYRQKQLFVLAHHLPKCMVILSVSIIVNLGRWCANMGGRGTFAASNSVPYTYQTISMIEGVKVLEGLNGKHGLPEEAHSSVSYIRLHNNGEVKQLRLYNQDLTAKTDIEYSIHQGKLSLHAHDYINGIRQPARPLTKEDEKNFRKFWNGLK